LPVGLVWLAASFFRRTLTLNSISFRFSPSGKEKSKMGLKKKEKNPNVALAAGPFHYSNMLLQGLTVSRSSVGFDQVNPNHLALTRILHGQRSSQASKND